MFKFFKYFFLMIMAIILSFISSFFYILAQLFILIKEGFISLLYYKKNKNES